MQTIQIGANIASLRKEKGVTQEELADYLGISKPAVSKWESGQSYPDILLLPRLAAYFNRTVDELLGYAAQMTVEEVKSLYIRLADAFADEPFDTVYARCEEAVKSHYACFRLLFAMAQLLVNHAPLAGAPDRVAAVYREASGLFLRVERESGETGLARQALSMRAFCALVLQQPDEAIKLLEGIEELSLSGDQLLAKAYAMQGETGKAKDVLQKYLYQNAAGLFGAFPDLMTCYADEPEKIDICLQKALALGDTFDFQDMHPGLYFTLYLTAAALYAALHQNDRALDLLEAYVDLLSRKDVFPLKLKGSAFFDRLEPYFQTLNLGTNVPRSNALICRDLKTTVTGNPAFQTLKDESRFRRIIRRLEHWEGDKR
ncbi:helix-turn-helix domain-containing protein [Ethanoligenens harbinense]|uniref:Helix-turn-helix domain protein n=1 Tax=Ethanoligenens harbinense (strain DSM 18485 / JCM 12961 / CGMCC 1.5033 / YUAN-3) TaxID=663278 RepID=E6U6T4_ETHHY|nr:helix-turn-helix transcriptional regulator [Ethanoligenens harbinense]ADU26901.1 helix-turn-helix domain protein [Ethanoligenens harbinense YUAN-3]AVQ95997.1 XRE family transcriptional regulator [Ethanoligenens harbinense YUAN-3]AYF38659.1 XRE family transcriptional regulator [Ethanoligenens harbinense]AYF41406.1 XRE family transcriptional regulator [Ethanoligenens harbinense]QCN92240.1 XRE family transcriptional regulator [Ethanoligenens harbinense]